MNVKVNRKAIIALLTVSFLVTGTYILGMGYAAVQSSVTVEDNTIESEGYSIDVLDSNDQPLSTSITINVIDYRQVEDSLRAHSAGTDGYKLQITLPEGNDTAVVRAFLEMENPMSWLVVDHLHLFIGYEKVINHQGIDYYQGGKQVDIKIGNEYRKARHEEIVAGENLYYNVDGVHTEMTELQKITFSAVRYYSDDGETFTTATQYQIENDRDKLYSIGRYDFGSDGTNSGEPSEAITLSGGVHAFRFAICFKDTYTVGSGNDEHEIKLTETEFNTLVKAISNSKLTFVDNTTDPLSS